MPDAQSLKTKRMVVKSLKDRLKRRFNVAVAEIGYTELWQRAEIAAVSIASARSVLESELEAITREIENHTAADVVRIDSELIE